jgi:hypothetical protein
MISKILIVTLAVGAFALGNPTARAGTFTMQFTASDFMNLAGNGVAPPTDPLTGMITYEAVGISDPILSFDSVDLTIDGHSYSPSDFGFYMDNSSPNNQVGVLTGGVTGINNHTDDFTIVWNFQTLNPVEVLYSSSQRDGIFLSTTFSNSSIGSSVVSQVPEPSTMALFFLSGGMVLCLKNRLGNKRQA